MKHITLALTLALFLLTTSAQAELPEFEGAPPPRPREAGVVAMGFECEDCVRHVQHPYNGPGITRSTNPSGGPGAPGAGPAEATQ